MINIIGTTSNTVPAINIKILTISNMAQTLSA